MSIQVVILAAGLGKRMHSGLPKVLHELAGKPLLQHVIETAHLVAADNTPIIVYGHGKQQLLEKFQSEKLTFVEQKEQAGTGHAAQQALPHLADADRVLILYGDVPLISADTLNNLIAATPENALGMVTAYLKNPQGYGRILRDEEGSVTGIVEEKDASEKERRISEINSGIYLVPAANLKEWLPALTKKNAQGEYYLTDIIPKAVAEGMQIVTVQPLHKDEIRGVNDRAQLMQLERSYQRMQAYQFLQQGVTIMDAERFDVRGQLRIGKDVTIDVNVIFEGNVVIGDGCRIGANTIIRDAVMATMSK